LVQVVIWYEYLVKFSPLIFADHCRYLRSNCLLCMLEITPVLLKMGEPQYLV
jgi:hypothetical protein